MQTKQTKLMKYRVRINRNFELVIHSLPKYCLAEKYNNQTKHLVKILYRFQTKVNILTPDVASDFVNTETCTLLCLKFVFVNK